MSTATRQPVATVTLADFEASQQRQDKGIRLEFKNVHERLQNMDDRIDKFEDRFGNFEGKMSNSGATNSWHDIHPVGALNPLADAGSRFQMPEYFPNKVAKFWRLQRPQIVSLLIPILSVSDLRTFPIDERLVSLLHFYNVQGLERWDMAVDESSDDDSDTNKPSEPAPTLEEVIRSNPKIGLEALAIRLGLNYNSIQHNMELKENMQGLMEQLKTKRERPESRDAEENKRPAKKLVGWAMDAGNRSEQTLKWTQEEFPRTILVHGIPFEVNVSNKSESPEIRSQIGWDPRPNPSPGPRLRYPTEERVMTEPNSPLPTRSKQKRRVAEGFRQSHASVYKPIAFSVQSFGSSPASPAPENPKPTSGKPDQTSKGEKRRIQGTKR